MLKDIHFRFTGFHGSAGRCQIRLAKAEKGKPLVIVCSQYKSYFGTSITNAIELIAESLFSQIANNRISGISFDQPIPFFEQWHADANVFDKLLARIDPAKYGNRFSLRRINIPELFSRVVWIEHYPEDIKAHSFGKHIRVVTLDESSNPVWHGCPSDKLLQRKTGFTLDQLLPDDGDLDLDAIEGDLEVYPASVEELRSFPGFHQVRWTEELLRTLPGLLTGARTYRGKSLDDDLEELSVHDVIKQFLAINLPAKELFEYEFKFSKKLGIYKSGKEKTADFAIFAPEGGVVDSIIEVKRTSSQSTELRPEVIKDVARLLLLSKYFQCSCYLLVCGQETMVRSELSKVKYLSLDDDDKSRDKSLAIISTDFDAEYSGHLSKFNIDHCASKLLGKNGSDANVTFLWQISLSDMHLRMHRPYEFNLSGISRG